MAIIGSDGRTTITVPSGSNANATAVDVPNLSTTTYSAFKNLPGSGYAISANFSDGRPRPHHVTRYVGLEV